MLQGLQLMERAELSELAKLARLDAKAGETLPEAELRRQILSWAGRVVGSNSNDPVQIERACLTWLAEHWNLEARQLESDNDELERALRIRIAEDASQYLAPLWWIAVALIAAGPPDALMPKIRLVDKAASLVVPSRSARQRLTDQWQEKAQTWGPNSIDQPEVVHALDQLKQAPEKLDQAFTFCLVIALADGRLALEEERLLRAMADHCGASHESVTELIQKVNSRYWDHQVEVTPKRAGEGDAQQDKVFAMQAAQKTLDSAGALEGLCLEACDKVVGLNANEPKVVAPKSGWQRVLGGVSGLKQFFSNRIRNDEHVNLVRLVYLSIIHQHADAAAKADAAARAAREQMESAVRAAQEVAARPDHTPSHRKIQLD